MEVDSDKRFEVSSIGKLYGKSLAMFAHHLEDESGNEVDLDEMEIDRPFFVVFESGTGLTKTSAVRIT